MVFRRVLSTYRVIIDRLWAVSPYIFANCCSVGRTVVPSSFREAVAETYYTHFKQVEKIPTVAVNFFASYVASYFDHAHLFWSLFLFFAFKYLCLVCSESDHLNNMLNIKKTTIILSVVSKHFSHVTFYAADLESGLIC